MNVLVELVDWSENWVTLKYHPLGVPVASQFRFESQSHILKKKRKNGLTDFWLIVLD